MNEKIKVGIVDDNYTLLNQLIENLSIADNIVIIFTANNGNDAIDKLSKLKTLPQVILMDIEMPEMNGIEATAAITRETDIKILILTVFDTDDKVFEAIKAGANGYLLKDSKPHRILTAIEDVLMGGAPMSPNIASKTLELLRNTTTTATTENVKLEDYKLTDREIEILKLLTNGKSYDYLANLLNISVGTVRKHVQNIYTKLHIHSKIEAVNLAHQHRWFTKIFF